MSASVWSPDTGTVTLSNLNRVSLTQVATAGQTLFYLVTPYTKDAQNLEVFVNGLKISPTLVTEYATGTSFSIPARTVGDVVEAVVFPATAASFEALASQAQGYSASAAASAAAAAASAASISQFTGAAIGGNLTFTSSGQRIVGDFSGATAINRVYFQSNSPGNQTSVGAIPGIGGTTSGFIVWNSSDATNGQYATLIVNGSEASIRTSYSGVPVSGTYFPLTFYVGGSEKLRIDSIGNVTLSAATGSLGYGIGAGGTTTQLTSRVTPVTLNRPTGDIVLFTAAGSTTAASFTVNNTLIGLYDTPVIAVRGATNKYLTQITNIVAGVSFEITFWTTGGTASDTPTFHFNLLKGVSS